MSCPHCHNEPPTLRVATITIAHDLTEDEHNMTYSCLDGSGEELSLMETLGLLEFMKAALVTDHLSPTECDCGEGCDV